MPIFGLIDSGSNDFLPANTEVTLSTFIITDPNPLIMPAVTAVDASGGNPMRPINWFTELVNMDSDDYIIHWEIAKTANVNEYTFKARSGPDTNVNWALFNLKELPTDANSLNLKSGCVPVGSFSGNPASATVSFSTSGDYLNTGYAVSLSVQTVDGKHAYTPTYTNKTISGFDIHLNSGNTNHLVEVCWQTYVTTD